MWGWRISAGAHGGQRHQKPMELESPGICKSHQSSGWYWNLEQSTWAPVRTDALPSALPSCPSPLSEPLTVFHWRQGNKDLLTRVKQFRSRRQNTDMKQFPKQLGILVYRSKARLWTQKQNKELKTYQREKRKIQPHGPWGRSAQDYTYFCWA